MNELLHYISFFQVVPSWQVTKAKNIKGQALAGFEADFLQLVSAGSVGKLFFQHKLTEILSFKVLKKICTDIARQFGDDQRKGANKLLRLTLMRLSMVA